MRTSLCNPYGRKAAQKNKDRRERALRSVTRSCTSLEHQPPNTQRNYSTASAKVKKHENFSHLLDPDFRAGKLDTGFLDRLLSQPAPPPGITDDGVDRTAERERVAALAAGIFAAMESASASPKPANGAAANGAVAPGKPSAWKQAASVEALRTI